MAKIAFFAQNWPFLGHFHTIGCIFLTSFATRVVPPHVFHCDPPFFPLLPATVFFLGYLWPKMTVLAQNWPFLGHFHNIGCICLTSFASRVVPSHVFHCDPPFVPLLSATGGLRGHLWPKMMVLVQNWPFLGPFHAIRCTYQTGFASSVVPPRVLDCDPPFDPILPAIWSLCGP